MTDLIGLIGTGITIAKGLDEICKEYDNSVLVRQITALNIQLAQAHNEAAKTMRKLRRLNAEVSERKNNPLTYTGTIYRGKDGFPYCPACYDNRRKRIHLKINKFPVLDGHLICPVCMNDFEG